MLGKSLIKHIGALLAVLSLPLTALAQPTFNASLSPATIGPGSNSTLTFTITNDSASPVNEKLCFIEAFLVFLSS